MSSLLLKSSAASAAELFFWPDRIMRLELLRIGAAFETGVDFRRSMSDLVQRRFC